MAKVHPETAFSNLGDGKPKLAAEEFNSESLGVETFDWNAGTFRHTPTRVIILNLIIQGVLCSALLVIPWLIYTNHWIQIDYNLIRDAPPEQLSVNVEVIRWCITLGLGLLGYWGTDLVVLGLIYSIYYGYGFSDSEVPRKVTRLVDHVLYLRGHLCRFSASLAMFLAAAFLFPLTVEEVNASMGDQKQSVINASRLEATAAVMTGFAMAQTFRQYGSTHSTNFFIKCIFTSLFAIFGIILAEKMLIQKISSIFFTRSSAQRLADNKFAVKITKRLRDTIVHSRPDLDRLDASTIIYQGLVGNAPVMTMKDFSRLLSPAEAEIYFSMLDKDQMKEVNQIQLSRSIGFFYEEQEWLRLSMLDQQKIIRKLDKLLMLFIYVFCFVVILAVFQVNLQTILAALGGLAAFLFFMSEGSLKTAFESIIFVIFTHPFDVGDMVMINGDNYTVKELGLWTSVFEGPTNRITYISNARLRTEKIVNYRRSPPSEDIVRINILPSTSMEKINAFEAKLTDWVKKNHRDYLPKVALTNTTIIDKQTMKIEVLYSHRSNWQNWTLKNMRARAFTLYVREALQDLEIELSPPKWHELH